MSLTLPIFDIKRDSLAKNIVSVWPNFDRTYERLVDMSISFQEKNNYNSDTNANGAQVNITILEILNELRTQRKSKICEDHHNHKLIICLDDNCTKVKDIICPVCYEHSHPSCQSDKIFTISNFLKKANADFEMVLSSFDKVNQNLGLNGYRISGEDILRNYIIEQSRKTELSNLILLTENLDDFSISVTSEKSMVVHNTKLEIIDNLLNRISEGIESGSIEGVNIILKELSNMIGSESGLQLAAKDNSTENLKIVENDFLAPDFASDNDKLLWNNSNDKINREVDKHEYSWRQTIRVRNQCCPGASDFYSDREITTPIFIFKNEKVDDDEFMQVRKEELLKMYELEIQNERLKKEVDSLKRFLNSLEETHSRNTRNELTRDKDISNSNIEHFFRSIADVANSSFLSFSDFVFVNVFFTNNVSLKLLYSSKRDSDLVSVFHEKCDNQGPTITFVKSGNLIAGGYSDVPWESTGFKYKTSFDSFLFSLSKRKRYTIRPGKNKNAIYCNSENGPCFGFDLCISYDIKSLSNYSHANKIYDFGDKENPQNELFGQLHFVVDEYEVYQVICV